MTMPYGHVLSILECIGAIERFRRSVRTDEASLVQQMHSGFSLLKVKPLEAGACQKECAEQAVCIKTL